LFGFGSIFGGGRRGARNRGGRDLRYDLEIDFEEAVHGLETKIQVPRAESCSDCSGTGGKDGEVRVCKECRGRGQVAFQQGFFTIARNCPRCGGKGRTVAEPCPACNGVGAVKRESTIPIRIPAGVDHGAHLRVTGQGEAASPGGPPGDLYVVLHVREHPVFQRQDRDVACEVGISISQAALGAEIEVPTLHGKKSLSVPSGTQSGTRFRLRGMGVPAINGGRRGDQYVSVVVRTPTRLSQEQRRLLEQLAELDGDDGPEPGIFDRVKSIFNA
jgi:molecular chaperone DnaJ